MTEVITLHILGVSYINPVRGYKQGHKLREFLLSPMSL